MNAAISQLMCVSLRPSGVLISADGRREADAVDIRDDRQAARRRQDPVADPRRAFRVQVGIDPIRQGGTREVAVVHRPAFLAGCGEGEAAKILALRSIAVNDRDLPIRWPVRPRLRVNAGAVESRVRGRRRRRVSRATGVSFKTEGPHHEARGSVCVRSSGRAGDPRVRRSRGERRRAGDADRAEVVAVGVGRGRPAGRGQPADGRARQGGRRADPGGKVYSLGRVYEHGMPLPGKRHFSLTIPGSPTGGPSGKNQGVYHDDLFSGEIGQIGTQLDGLGHVGVRIGDDDYFYNGFRRSQFGTAYGLEKLGIENVGVFFTRGVLVDVAAAHRVERMKAGEVITPGDLEAALKAEGLAVREGDVVLIRTGHGRLWMKDNAAYGAGEPGIGMEAARWLADRKIALVGTDTWATEVVPPEDPDRPFPVHQHLLVRNGIYNLENLDLEDLARDRVHEFAFIFAPLRLKGATGSPGNPIAVR